MGNSKNVSPAVKVKSKVSHVPHSPGVERLKNLVSQMEIDLQSAIEKNNETMTKDLSRGIKNLKASILRMSN